MFTVELDVDYTEDKAFAADCKLYGITIANYIEEGPGGGNPCYTLTHHDYAYLKEFVEKCYDPDGVDWIEEV